ncbi:hypothetical protein CEXT_608641 [Caerostris extrusa]|uniref:Uncharacterized protein n=1 Tax=Caerostris extrusa TaxID=172846 RepID=A0AAV4R6R7_CAEEX|nr:hypothetical protein CEXT_608641 [Caerostris extrusa]
MRAFLTENTIKHLGLKALRVKWRKHGKGDSSTSYRRLMLRGKPVTLRRVSVRGAYVFAHLDTEPLPWTNKAPNE